MPRPSKDAMPVNAKAPKSIGSTQSLTAFVKGVCDIMRRSNCASALQYVSELTWILFLRILDAQESRQREVADVQGRAFAPALRAPLRWKDWAALIDEKSTARTPEGKPFGWKRHELSDRIGGLIAFINNELLPYLPSLNGFPDWRERAGNAGKPSPGFARWLASRGTTAAESDFSWAVDFDVRRAQAREDMAPHLAEVVQQRDEILRLKELHTQMRHSGVEAEALAACRELQSRVEKSKREAEARANAIDVAVYDLKTVNPRARNERDTRTPGEILDSIATHGAQVEQALTQLRRHVMMAGEVP